MQVDIRMGCNNYDTLIPGIGRQGTIILWVAKRVKFRFDLSRLGWSSYVHAVTEWVENGSE